MIARYSIILWIICPITYDIFPGYRETGYMTGQD